MMNWEKSIEEKYQADIDSIRKVMNEFPLCCYFKDLDCRYRLISKRCSLLPSACEKDLLGKTDLEVQKDPEDAYFFHRDDLEVLQNRQERTSVRQVKDGDGFRYMKMTKKPVFTLEGGLLGVFGLIEDITDTVLVEQENQRQLEMIMISNQIDKLLLKLHKNRDYMTNILHLIAEFESADRAYIFEFTDETRARLSYEFCFQPEKSQIKTHSNADFSNFPIWLETLKKGRTLFFDNNEAFETANPGYYQMLKQQGVSCLYAMPIFSSLTQEDQLIAFLGVDNPVKSKVNRHFLERLAFGLSIAFDNMKEYDEIQKMITYDLATGILNHNQYIKYITEFSSEGIQQLGCIYMDVNGLHGFNNRYGHRAGDRMLEQIAEALKAHFGVYSVFRVGGDEFVVFAENTPESTLIEKLDHFNEELEIEEIVVSAGLEFRTSNFNIEEMLKAADTKMFSQKDRFYQKLRVARTDHTD